MAANPNPSEKWQEASKAGFQIIPDLLLKKQAQLDISATDLVVLINITMHWWYADQRPFPRSSAIAARMGVEPRTVQRSLRRMTELGLVKKVKEKDEFGEDREVCDLTGLLERLNGFAETDKDYLIRTARKSDALHGTPV